MAEIPGVPGGKPAEFKPPQQPTGPEGPQGGSLGEPLKPGVPEIPGRDVPQRFGFHGTGRTSESIPYGIPQMSNGPTENGPSEPGESRGIPEIPARSNPEIPTSSHSANTEKSSNEKDSTGETRISRWAAIPERQPEQPDRFARVVADLQHVSGAKGEDLAPGTSGMQSEWSEHETDHEAGTERKSDFNIDVKVDEQGVSGVVVSRRSVGRKLDQSESDDVDHERTAWRVGRDGRLITHSMTATGPEVVEPPAETPDDADPVIDIPLQRPHVGVPAPRPETTPPQADVPEPRTGPVPAQRYMDESLPLAERFASFDEAVASGAIEGARVDHPDDVQAFDKVMRFRTGLETPGDIPQTRQPE